MTVEDMAALQLQLAQTEGDARTPIQRLLSSIQKAMESRMAAVTKDIEALMQSSGNIEENIRECLQKQEWSGGFSERALTFLYTTINEELESKVPMVNRAEPRRELLKAYFAEESEEESSSIDDVDRARLIIWLTTIGMELELEYLKDKPQLMADALLGLVKEAQAQKGQKGFDLKGALLRIREVALDVGVAQGEVCGDEVSEKFLEAMGPLTDACADLA
eukprot:s401_g16.t1